MRIKFAFRAAALALAALPATAQASLILPLQCVSVASSQGCLFTGNINANSNPFNPNGYKWAENLYNLYNDVQPFAGPNIDLHYLFDTDTTAGLITGGDGASGSWSLPGYLVDFVAVKAGDFFVLYKIDPASSGNWDTFDIPHKNNPKDVSHIVFFGNQAGAVPEPAAWGMMIGGFGMAGAAMRRRKTRKRPELA